MTYNNRSNPINIAVHRHPPNDQVPLKCDCRNCPNKQSTKPISLENILVSITSPKPISTGWNSCYWSIISIYNLFLLAINSIHIGHLKFFNYNMFQIAAHFYKRIFLCVWTKKRRVFSLFCLLFCSHKERFFCEKITAIWNTLYNKTCSLTLNFTFYKILSWNQFPFKILIENRALLNLIKTF